MGNDNMYGVVTIDGKNYLERWQVLPFEQRIITNGQVVNPLKVSLPGAYDFRLKAITRDEVITATGAPVSNRFKVRFGNTDGAIWYSQGGVGGTTDRVLDTLICGSAAFPYVVIPELYYSKNSAIMMEIEDVSLAATANPYTIYFAFHGSYLIPV